MKNRIGYAVVAAMLGTGYLVSNGNVAKVPPTGGTGGTTMAIENNESIPKKIFHLNFYYFESELDKSSDFVNAKTYLKDFLDDDKELLNNLSNELTLNLNFEIGEIYQIDDTTNLFSERVHLGPSKDTISIFLDPLDYSSKPNRYNSKSDFIILNRAQRGVLSVLLHEIIHKVKYTFKDSNSNVDKHGNSFVHKHINSEIMADCYSIEEIEPFLPFCFNLMASDYSLPFNLLLSQRQVDDLNGIKVDDDPSASVNCYFNNPNGWDSLLINEVPMDAHDCCTTPPFDFKDISKVLTTLTNYRALKVADVAKDIQSLLKCFSGEIVGEFTISQTDLTPKIESVRDDAKKLYENRIKLDLSKNPKARLEWEKTFLLAKQFLNIWLKQSDLYVKLLKLESELLTKNVPQINSKKYFKRQIEIRNNQIESYAELGQLNNNINFSTGFNNQTKKLHKGTVDNNWTLVSAQNSANVGVLPRAANIVKKAKAWKKPIKSKWISAFSSASNSNLVCQANDCSSECKPYIFERCFSVPKSGLVSFNFKVLHDDFFQLVLKGPSGFDKALYLSCDNPVQPNSNFKEQKKVYKTYLLEPGKYCVQAKVYDWGVYFGFNLEGFVEGTPNMFPLKISE